MDYINSTTDEIAEKTDSERIKKIHSRVKEIKASEKMGVKLMQKWEELAYAREDGWAVPLRLDISEKAFCLQISRFLHFF